VRTAVILDGAKLFVIAKQSVGAGERLNQIFVLQHLIQIQCIDPLGVKACQHLIHHDQQIKLFFRGALDVYASTINDEMKLAVTHALARLAKEPVPQEVLKTYGLKSLSFGREYLIPKPSDPRLLAVVATAVARAAIESGVARREIEDWDAYAASLTRRVKNTK